MTQIKTRWPQMMWKNNLWKSVPSVASACYKIILISYLQILLGAGRYSLDYILYHPNKEAFRRSELIGIIFFMLATGCAWLVFGNYFITDISILLIIVTISGYLTSFMLITQKCILSWRGRIAMILAHLLMLLALPQICYLGPWYGQLVFWKNLSLVRKYSLASNRKE